MKWILEFPNYIGIVFIITASMLLLFFNFFPEGFVFLHFESLRSYHQQALRHHILKDIFQINIHAILGILMVILNLFVFSEKLRKRNIIFHKYLGFLYSFIGSLVLLSSFLLVENMYAKPFVSLAVYSVGFFWFSTLSLGLFFLFLKEIRLHRYWMTKNLFFTLSTFWIRPWVVLELALIPGRSVDVAFSNGFWMSIIITLLVSELYSNWNSLVVGRNLKLFLIKFRGIYGR